jgi:hypothetical protein
VVFVALISLRPRSGEISGQQVSVTDVISGPVASAPAVIAETFGAIIVLPQLTVTPSATVQPTPKPAAPIAKPTPVLSSTPLPPVPTTTPTPQTGPGQVGSNCPVSTQNCVPCNVGEPYCRVEAGKSSGFKGWACQNNNPGNIRYSQARNNLISGQGGIPSCGQRNGYMVFKDYPTGHNSLKAYIKAIGAGQHSSYSSCGDCNLVYFFNLYAPTSDGNNPNSYAAKVATALGVDAQTTTLTWIVANKLDPFINAIQAQEDWFVR